jgi:hypothetical protein
LDQRIIPAITNEKCLEVDVMSVVELLLGNKFVLLFDILVDDGSVVAYELSVS